MFDKAAYSRKWREGHRAYRAEYRRKYEAEHRKEIAEKRHAYRLAHRQEIAEYNREWIEKNPDYHKNWNNENHDRSLECKRKWMADHRDRIREQERVRHRAHHDKATVKWQNRNAKTKRGANGTITPSQWREVKELFDYRCAYCGEKQENPTMDHVVPLIKGGTHTVDNVVPACKHCNSAKNSYSLLIFFRREFSFC